MLGRPGPAITRKDGVIRHSAPNRIHAVGDGIAEQVAEEIQNRVAQDPDLTASVLRGLADRRDNLDKGDYLFPDLSDGCKRTLSTV